MLKMKELTVKFNILYFQYRTNAGYDDIAEEEGESYEEAGHEDM